MHDIIKSTIPDSIPLEAQAEIAKTLDKLVGDTDRHEMRLEDLDRLVTLLKYNEECNDYSGFHRWFVPGTPFGIEHLPKHRAFFKSTLDHRETLMLGGNRCGKTRAGATAVAILATGQYPDWWEGVRFATPTDCWAVGKTGQSTRDTVQKELLGAVGSIGTGALPRDTIIRTTARQGIAGAVDIVEVRHVSGRTSTIGFKSYDQKPSSFFGTARHLVWADEPCPELVYHEMLMRVAMLPSDPIEGPRGGRMIHTITPKEGLTRLLADYLRDCDLLAGATRVKGLEAMKILEELDDTDEFGNKRES